MIELCAVNYNRRGGVSELSWVFRERERERERKREIHSSFICCGGILKTTTEESKRNARTMPLYPIQIPIPFVIFYPQKNKSLTLFPSLSYIIRHYSIINLHHNNNYFWREWERDLCIAKSGEHMLVGHNQNYPKWCAHLDGETNFYKFFFFFPLRKKPNRILSLFFFFLREREFDWGGIDSLPQQHMMNQSSHGL